jgi:hypothetical protein
MNRSFSFGRCVGWGRVLSRAVTSVMPVPKACPGSGLPPPVRPESYTYPRAPAASPATARIAAPHADRRRVVARPSLGGVFGGNRLILFEQHLTVDRVIAGAFFWREWRGRGGAGLIGRQATQDWRGSWRRDLATAQCGEAGKRYHQSGQPARVVQKNGRVARRNRTGHGRSPSISQSDT